MGDQVASHSRAPLKRSRSAAFSPTAEIFFTDGDTVPSFMSCGMSFGAAVFANEMNDSIPSAFAHFDDDGVGSAGSLAGGASLGLRQPIDHEFGGWNEPIYRTRSQETIKQLLEEDGMAPVTPAFGRTPRGRADGSGTTPRCRQDLEHVDPVKLELVGTTLVAKSASDGIRLDVGSVLLGAVAPLQPLQCAHPLVFLQMEVLSSNLELHKKKFANITLHLPGSSLPRAPEPRYGVVRCVV
jgi:hypothetical protein